MMNSFKDLLFFGRNVFGVGALAIIDHKITRCIIFKLQQLNIITFATQIL